MRGPTSGKPTAQPRQIQPRPAAVAPMPRLAPVRSSGGSSGAAVLASVVLAAGAESVARMGHEISFGNLLCGGPAGVPAILSDSNVDWGQEQGLLFDRVVED